MKKTSLYLALAMTAVMGFTSCEDDKEPVLQTPTEFVLNTPALANQFYQLEEGAEVEFTCSQPDYGYSAIADYSIDICLDENFADGTYANVAPSNNNGHSAAMTFRDSDIAVAMCGLHGVESLDDGKLMFPDGFPVEPLYIRARCSVAGLEESVITSNVIKLDRVQTYLAIKEPGKMYLIGAVSGGWIEPSIANMEALAPWVLMETGVETNVFTGVFDIDAGNAMFRFYSELTAGGWGDNNSSWGSQKDDNPIDYTITDGTFTGALVKGGKGSFNFPAWTGGKMTITLDLRGSSPTVKIEAGDADMSKYKCIYLVGNASGWWVSDADADVKYEPYKLYDLKDNGIYTGTFDVAPGNATFRFYSKLGDWETNSIGAQIDDNPVDIVMNDGVYSGSCVEGKGACNIPDWAGGKIFMTVNTTDMTVKFENANPE